MPAKLARLAKPKADNPWLNMCVNCQEEENLRPFEDVKICSDCHQDLHYGKTLTQERVCEWFGLTKAEAKKIPHKRGTHGRYGSVVHIFEVSAAVRAAKKKYGSLYLMAQEK
jgi:hypothetical protein